MEKTALGTRQTRDRGGTIGLEIGGFESAEMLGGEEEQRGRRYGHGGVI